MKSEANPAKPTKLGFCTVMGVAVVTFLLMDLLRDQIEAKWLRAFVAAGIAGGLTAVALITKRMRQKRNGN